MNPHLGEIVRYGLIVLFLSLFCIEARWQYQDNQYVKAVAADVTRSAQGNSRSVVIALRDYIRSHVTHQGFDFNVRPFLRHSAADTLRSGKGHCGEATRTFVVMADSVGIRAQRLYLEGKKPHIVAEVTLSDGEEIIVDSYDEPYIPEIASLDQVMRQPEFSS